MLRPSLTLLFLGLCGCAEAPGARAPSGDAAMTACELRFADEPGLVLGPSDARDVVARVSPPRGVNVRFAIVGTALDASLNRTAAASGADGVTQVRLTAPSSAAGFQLRASADCGGEALLDVSVDARGTGAIDVNTLYRGNRGPSGLTVDLLRAESCDGAATSAVERSATLAPPGGVVQFGGLMEGTSYTVRATATGVARAVLADACAGPFRVQPGERRPINLLFTDRPSALGSSYSLDLAFDLGDAAANSAGSWLAAPRSQISAAGGEALVFLPELADAVAASVPAELRAAARATLVTALEGELGARIDDLLLRRSARIDDALFRLTEQTAAGLARVRVRGTLSAPLAEESDWRGSGVTAVLDPGTPEVDADDVSVTLDEAFSARLSRSGAETIVGSINGLPMPYARLARRTLSEVVRRFGAATTGEFVALTTCPVLATAVSSVAALCGEGCVLAACRQSADRLGRSFEDAVAGASAERATVDLRFAAPGRVAPGTLRIERIETLMAGRFQNELDAVVVANAVMNAAP